MKNIKDIEIEDYNYILEDDKIAKFPLKKRDDSKLLVYDNKQITEKKFHNISDILPSNSLIVFNNTKVIKARLFFKKKTGAAIEIFCLEPYEPSEFEQVFASVGSCKWICIVGNLKKWKDEILETELIFDNQKILLKAIKLQTINDNILIEFNWNSELTFSEILDKIGNIPIPPYLNRNSNETDLITYQTVYSKIDGSVAAPTAGLHFTNDVLKKLNDKNIDIQEITLHVGAGTFKPVKNNLIIEHEMHVEHFFVNRQTIEKLIENKSNITAVGTTTVRTLESIYWLGVKLLSNNILNNIFKIEQWEVYQLPQNYTLTESLNKLLEFLNINNLEFISAVTQIFIVPSYKFRIINRLITNFHQPKSTLLLLVSAIVGENWKEIYNYALQNNFRFLSYGDSSLLMIND